MTLAVVVFVATVGLAQTSEPAAANASTTSKPAVHRLASDGTPYVPSVSDYLPDISQTDMYFLQGQVGAFYRGAALSFMLLVAVGMLIRTRQQARQVQQLEQQEKAIRLNAEEQQREFLRRQHLHFENTPLVVVELDAQRRIREWTGRAEAVFGWRAMEVLGKVCEEISWVDKSGIAALQAAFGPATGTEKAGRIVTMRHQARDGGARLIEWHVSVMPEAGGGTESVLALGLDVTEREVAEANLRQVKNRYTLAAQAGGSGLWSLRPAQGNVSWEEPLPEMLGYQPKDFPTREGAWRQLFHPDDLMRFEEALDTCLHEPAARQVLEARLRHRDGSYRWLQLAFSIDPSATQAGAVVTGTATDLTRVKLAEEKFRGLVDQSLAGIFILQENRVVYANPKFWSIVRSGGSRPPLRPEFLELVHPEDRAVTAERLRPLYARSGHEAALLFRLSGPQGTAVAVQGHGIVSEHEGEPAILGLVMDVSHRFAQEQTSRRLSQVVEQSPVAILITNPAGVIEYANRKFCEVSGYAHEELLGQMPQLLRAPQTPEDFYTDLWARLRQGKKWEGEHLNRAKDGRQFTSRAVLFPVFDESGAVTHCVKIMEDITSQRTLEERLARAQRLESMGNLAGGIAHDLNNILAPVRLGAEFMKTLPFTGKEREIIEVMDISIHRATELVQQVLAFSRGRRSKRETMELAPLISELERLVRESFPRDVRFDVRLVSDLASVKADSTQILQVLMNLCVNARDAMPAGGVITLAADNVLLGSAQTASFPGAQPGEHVRIRVTDMGTGIPAVVRDKIFEPFFTTKDVGKGTGLGLSTALGIMQEHQGIIELESTGPQGTTFVVYLPVSTELPAAIAPVAAMPPVKKSSERAAESKPGLGHTVLVVDDEVPLRQAVAFILGQRGYTVLEAADGYQALEAVKKHGQEVEVVLLDVMMPRMDGLATLKALREMRPELQVIATSGVNHDSRVEALRRLGVQHFLLKPYRNQELLEALESCITNHVRQI
jgi:two-component system, cell cycle sensor histidine kinase and response regulator CckA